MLHTFFSALGSLIPYIMVYMRELGLTPIQSSFIFGITFFVTTVTRPVFGIVADKLRKHGLILIICSVVSSALFGCLIFLSPATQISDHVYNEELYVVCDRDFHYVELCLDNNCTDRNNSLYGLNESIRCDLECYGAPFGHTNQSNTDVISENTYVDTRKYVAVFHEVFETESDHAKTACPKLQIVSINDAVNNQLEMTYCEQRVEYSCKTICSLPLYESVITCAQGDDINHNSLIFGLFAIIYFVASIFRATIPNLIDALTYDHLGEERGKWGQQRVWGTFGFAVFGVSVGFIIHAMKDQGDNIEYSWCFIMYIIHICLAAAAVYFYKTSDHVRCSHTMQKLRKLLRNPEVMSLFSIVFIFGCLSGIIEAFRFWHLQNLGAPPQLLGLCLVFICLPEIFIMFTMRHIIAKLGEYKCLYAACLAYACRFLGYSFLRNPWFVLLIEPLHGVTYGIMYGAASAYGSRLTPQGMHGTMQAILTTLHFGLGKCEFNHNLSSLIDISFSQTVSVLLSWCMELKYGMLNSQVRVLAVWLLDRFFNISGLPPPSNVVQDWLF